METSFFYNVQDKELCFKLREKVTTKYNIELKGKGRFNPSTAEFQYRAHAKKNLCIGSEEKQEPGTTPLTLGLGAAISSDATEPVIALSAKKQMALLDGPNTVLSAKMEVDANAKTGKVMNERLALKFSHKAMNFTKRQDLKLSVGVDVEGITAGAPKPMPRLQLRENNWAVHYRKNLLYFTYDL